MLNIKMQYYEKSPFAFLNDSTQVVSIMVYTDLSIPLIPLTEMKSLHYRKVEKYLIWNWLWWIYVVFIRLNCVGWSESISIYYIVHKINYWRTDIRVEVENCTASCVITNYLFNIELHWYLIQTALYRLACWRYKLLII